MQKLLLSMTSFLCVFIVTPTTCRAAIAGSRQEVVELLAFIQAVDTAPVDQREKLIQNLDKKVTDRINLSDDIIDYELKCLFNSYFAKKPLLFFKITALETAIKHGMINEIKTIFTQQFIDELLYCAHNNPLFYDIGPNRQRVELFRENLKLILTCLNRNNPQENHLYDTIQTALLEIERAEKQFGNAIATVLYGSLASIVLTVLHLSSHDVHNNHTPMNATKEDFICGGLIACSGFIASAACGYIVWQYYQKPSPAPR